MLIYVRATPLLLRYIFVMQQLIGMGMGVDMQCKGVTIGIPLYNEERYIEEALRSAASQCETVWVADNASTDGSATICEMVSREYSNIHFVRQPRNIGAIANFKFLLDKADTPLFMWLGGHDALPDGYVRQLKQLLENCPEAVLAYGASHHVDVDGKPVGDYEYFYHAMLADRLPLTRILGLISHLHDCSLVHGVFRREALRAAWNASKIEAYIGVDHVLLAHAAINGPFLYSPETYLIRRDAHPDDTQQEQLKRMDACQLDRKQFICHELQRRLYALAVTVSKGTGLSGFLFRSRARFSLTERFGPFGESLMAKRLEFFLVFLIRQSFLLPLNTLGVWRNTLVRRAHRLFE